MKKIFSKKNNENWWYPIGLFIFIALFVIIVMRLEKSRPEKNYFEIIKSMAYRYDFQRQSIIDSLKYELENDSIENQKILDSLYIIFLAREGFSDTVYYDSKGYAYQGYGHQIKKTDHFKKSITIEFADSLLKKDIKLHWKYVKDIQKRRMFEDIYRMFTSGTYTDNFSIIKIKAGYTLAKSVK